MFVVAGVVELLQPHTSLGDPALLFKLTGDYPTPEYTVQYRKSAMDVAIRLMERFGISYLNERRSGHLARI